jgi:hypothetical protein
MFRWYQNAAKRYVFLQDVYIPNMDVLQYQSAWEEAFCTSRWFTRGWTLQELIAPTAVECFSVQHQRLGDKQSLGLQIRSSLEFPIEPLQSSSMSSLVLTNG